MGAPVEVERQAHDARSLPDRWVVKALRDVGQHDLRPADHLSCARLHTSIMHEIRADPRDCSHPTGAHAHGCAMSLGSACEAVGDGVRGVMVQGVTGTVVAAGGLGVGVAGGKQAGEPDGPGAVTTRLR